jgi:hypothetical protein
MSDAPGSFSVGLRSRLLPEDRRLGESHDLAEVPRIGCVERPMLPLELPRLLLRILCQCPLRFGEGLVVNPAPLPVATIGLRRSGIRHRIDRRHHAGIGPSGGAGPALRVAETFHFRPSVLAIGKCFGILIPHGS